MDQVGSRLKQERLMRGWSQRDLAAKARVTAETISTIETNQHEPRPSTLTKLAKALSIEVRDLFEEPALSGKVEAPTSGPSQGIMATDPADLEDWASGVDSVAELEPVRRALWLKWRELAEYDRVVSGGARALADALEAEEKLAIIDRRMTELAPAPLATIVMRRDEKTQVIFHRDPTNDERARLRAEHPGAIEVEAKQVAFAY